MMTYCDVVAMVTVKVEAGAAGVMVPEPAPQFAAVAPPTLQVTVSGAAKPAIGVSVPVVVTLSPATTEPEVGFSAIVKSMPLPVNVAESPLYSRLVELTPSVPFCAPVVVGRKVTVIGQLAPAAIVVPQADVLTVYCPVVAKAGTGRGPPARLVSVRVCFAEAPTSRLPKVNELPESE